MAAVAAARMTKRASMTANTTTARTARTAIRTMGSPMATLYAAPRVRATPRRSFRRRV